MHVKNFCTAANCKACNDFLTGFPETQIHGYIRLWL